MKTNAGEPIPEWDLFGRQDNVEAKTKRLEMLGRAQEREAFDSLVIALTALKVGFTAHYWDAAEDARFGKDEVLKMLKDNDVSRLGMEHAEQVLLGACEFLESRQ